MTTKRTTGHSHGFRHKSRSVLTKRQPRGVSFLLREYHEGDRALVIIDPRQHKGMPHRRYHGKVGTVTNVGRRTVTLDIKLGNKSLPFFHRFTKRFIRVSPVISSIIRFEICFTGSLNPILSCKSAKFSNFFLSLSSSIDFMYVFPIPGISSSA